MNILLVSATEKEIAPLIGELEDKWERKAPRVYEQDKLLVQLLISGVGVTATAFAMGYYLGRAQPDLLINAGVAGALDRELELGQVVQVVSERFADLGAEESDGSFLDVFQLGLDEPDRFPFRQGKLLVPEAQRFDFLPPVHGLSVHKVHGQEQSIAQLRRRYPEAQVESMEGAAFFYAALIAELPFLQIRAISNYVEPRDREKWELGKAVSNLNAELIEVFEGLKGKGEG